MKLKLKLKWNRISPDFWVANTPFLSIQVKRHDNKMWDWYVLHKRYRTSSSTPQSFQKAKSYATQYAENALLAFVERSKK